jgi:HEAT repeat protein
LKKALKDEEPWVRRNAALALGKLGPDAADLARKEVFDALDDADADVRLAALEALANLGPPARDELPALLSILHESARRRQAKVSLHVARSLARLGPEAKDAVPDLRTLLKSDEREVRLQAIQTLRKIGPEARKAAPELIEHLKDADKSLRLPAAFALTAVDPAMTSEGKDGLSVLVLALRPESTAEINEAKTQERVKEIAVVLVKLGGSAAEGLRRAIEGEFRGGRRDSDAAKLNAAARETALKIIADIGPDAHSTKMIATLIELQRGDPSRAVRDAAKQAYIKLQGKN